MRKKRVQRMDSMSRPLTFPSALLLLFIGLKLTETIHWSWWWVFAPVWIPGVVVTMIVLYVFLRVLLQEWLALHHGNQGKR